MEERYLYGTIQFYSLEVYQDVADIISGLQNDNFFNLTIHEQFKNNKGSIIIPFAKVFRADPDDIHFISDKISDILSLFSGIGLFALELVIEAEAGKLIKYSLSHISGTVTVQSFDLSANLNSEYNVVLRNNRFHIDMSL